MKEVNVEISEFGEQKYQENSNLITTNIHNSPILDHLKPVQNENLQNPKFKIQTEQNSKEEKLIEEIKTENIDVKIVDLREIVSISSEKVKGNLKRTKSRVEVDLDSVEEFGLPNEHIPPQEKLRVAINNGLEQFVPKQEEKKTKTFQTIFLNDRASNKKQWWFWPSNYIRTTRYTFLTFLPLNLLEQFRRLSNIYFLATMIITLIPGVSPVFPITSILPLVVILGVTAIKDGIEDLLRWRDDLSVNNKSFDVIRNGKIVKIPSKSIEIGDIVIVNKNQDFPSDLLLLSCSNPDGIAFVETANLDGETNLKPRICVKETMDIKSIEKFGELKAKIQVEKPNEFLHKFTGQYNSSDDEKKAISLDQSNLLLKGSVLRNTKYIFGVAVYVGKQTKMFKNLKSPKSKFSSLDRKLNKVIFAQIIFQQVSFYFIHSKLATFLFVTLSAVFQNTIGINSFYILRPDKVNATYVVSDWLTYFVLFNLVIPMSLFVGLEFVKAFQAKIMEFDIDMSHGDKTMKAKTSNLNEELSQIDFVFSDKTGTLTENVMAFKKAFIRDIYYDITKNPSHIKDLLIKNELNEKSRENLYHFVLALALNHGIIPETDSEGNLLYEGASPDEVALVTAASICGFKLTQRSSSGMEVEILGQKLFFEILCSIDFTSERKMMTVIIKTPEDKIFVYCKGADNVMLEKIIWKTDQDKKLIENCKVELEKFSTEGLRTLIIAYKELTIEEYKEWDREYKDASCLMQKREESVAIVAKKMENNFKLLGCTAIEDKLQDGVPEAVDYLLKMGIQVWVLTGDKTETAINISHCANVIDRKTTEKLIISSESTDELRKEMLTLLEYVKSTRKINKNSKFSLVVGGKSLVYGLNEHKQLFAELSKYCNSAICCRLLPIQKAEIVRIILQTNKKKGISIGDGANDVSMIQSADVGVGIMGLEGGQAAATADYAIPRFKQLVRLIAIHGRYCYVRNSDYLHISFYKNMIIVYGLFLYSFFTAYTGQTLYDSWTMTVYNTLFTSMLPFIPAIFEKDIREEVILRNPHVFQTVKNGALFNLKTLIYWFVICFYHQIVVFFVMYGANNIGVLGSYLTDDIWTYGAINNAISFTTIMIVCAMSNKSLTLVSYLLYFCSWYAYFIFHYFYSLFPNVMGYGNFFYVAFVILRSQEFYILLLLCLGMNIIPVVIYKYIKLYIFPTDEIELMKKDVEEEKLFFNIAFNHKVEKSIL